MNIKYYFKKITGSFILSKYKKISSGSMMDAIKYFFFVFIVGLVLMCVFSIPFLIRMPSQIGDKMDGFENFNIDLNITTKEPLTLTKQPLIIIDKNRKNLSTEFGLFTNEKFIYRKYFFFGKNEIGGKPDYNLAEDRGKLIKMGSVLFIILIPSILLVISLFFLTKFLFFIFLFSAIAFFIIHLFKYKLSLKKIIKIAIYSSTPSILLDLMLFPYIKLGLYSLIPFVILFILALFTISEKQFHIKHKPSEKKDIFKDE
ncbi:DUF1189 family protein [Candidatus Woesearchaeota archaeon]|nr:DUF1189 family protein [Candidatus Woesearchaeota archaeon]